MKYKSKWKVDQMKSKNNLSRMSCINPPVSKKKRKESACSSERRLIKWICSHYFNMGVGGNDNVTRVVTRVVMMERKYAS